jgi:cytochrome c-type biogenesis protein CcmH
VGIQKMRAFAPRLALALLVPLLGLALYLQAVGPDTPGAEVQGPLPAEAAVGAGAGADNDVRRLRAHLDRQPRDARAWVILARLQAETDRFEEAAQAYDKALARSSKVAADPAVWCEYADALGMAQGGSLVGRPREFIDRALALNPNHPKALEMAGSSEYAQGDYAAALRFWRPLLAAQKPGSRAYAELAAAIARTERLAATAVAAKRN